MFNENIRNNVEKRIESIFDSFETLEKFLMAIAIKATGKEIEGFQPEELETYFTDKVKGVINEAKEEDKATILSQVINTVVQTIGEEVIEDELQDKYGVNLKDTNKGEETNV